IQGDEGRESKETALALELAAIRLIEAERDRIDAIEFAVRSWENDEPTVLNRRTDEPVGLSLPASPPLVVQPEAADLARPGAMFDRRRASTTGRHVSPLVAVTAISATAFGAREILLGRSGSRHRRRFTARPHQSRARAN